MRGGTRAWLSRQHDGTYMLSRFDPILARVEGTDYDDFYLQPGDPIGVRHLCAPGIVLMFGRALELMETVAVNIELKDLGERRKFEVKS